MAGPSKEENIVRVRRVWKSGQVGCVGHEDEMALGPPGRGGWEEKEPGEVPEGL